MTNASIKTALADCRNNINAGETLRSQKYEAARIHDIIQEDNPDPRLSDCIKLASVARTKILFNRFSLKAISRINELTDQFKIENGSHCKTCRFVEKTYLGLHNCVTHRPQCLRCNVECAHETEEEFEANETARRDKEAESMREAAAAMEESTEKENTLLTAIAENGLDGMGGDKPADLHGDNYSWFQAEDLVNLTTFSLNTICGIISSLDKKGFIQEDSPDWFLTTEGINRAQEIHDRNAAMDQDQDHEQDQDQDQAPSFNLAKLRVQCETLVDRVGSEYIIKGIKAGYAAIKTGQRDATDFVDPAQNAWENLITEEDALEEHIYKLQDKLHGITLVKAVVHLDGTLK